MDLRAQFGQETYQAQLKQMPHTINKFVLVSALKQKLGGLADLRQARESDDRFRPYRHWSARPGAGEKGQQHRVSGDQREGRVQCQGIRDLGNAIEEDPSDVRQSHGILERSAGNRCAMTVALSPLNVLAGVAVDQTFSLSIDKSANVGVDTLPNRPERRPAWESTTPRRFRRPALPHDPN